MQRDLRRQGRQILNLPLYWEGQLLHAGRGTLATLRSPMEDRHRYAAWAREQRAGHFEGNPAGARLLDAFLDVYRSEVGVTLETLVESFLRPERVVIGPGESSMDRT
jgi:hypothetical protein